MSDLISRKAVLKNIEKIRQSAQMIDDTHRADIIMHGMYLCEKAVRNQPSAQRTGEWIDRSEGGRILNPWWESHKCDQCGYFGSGAWNYCPYCGSHNGSEL